MNYCTGDDVLAATDQQTLIGLTDDHHLGKVDDDNVAAAIAKATDEINARLNTFLMVLPTKSEPLLTRIAVQITLYHLFLRRNLTDSRKEEYVTCQKMLADLQTGKLQLQCQVPDITDASAPGASYTTPGSLLPRVPTGFYTRQAYPW